MKTSLSFKRLITSVLLGLVTVSAQLPASAAVHPDAVAGATATTVPSRPLLTVTGSPGITDNIINLGSNGGSVSIAFTATDLSASSYPGSLQIGTLSNGSCVTDSSGLPAGAQLVLNNNPAVSPPTQATGSINWNIASGTPSTTIYLCAYNNFWVAVNGMTIRGITINTGSPVASVRISSAIYTAKTRTFTVKGNVTPVAKKPSLNGTPVAIEDSDSGENVLTGVIRSNAFSLSMKTIDTAPPAFNVTAMVANTLSSNTPVRVVGNITESVTIKFPDFDGAIQGSPYLYQLQASDTLNNPVTYTLNRGPAGLTLTPGGLVSWTPTASNSALGQVANYTVTAISTTGVSKTLTFGIGVCATGTNWMDGMGGMCM